MMTGDSRQLGSYRLLRRIGVGGMAEVYEAQLPGAGGSSKRLAIKLLLPHFQRDPEVVRSFIDEATIAAGLSHPNIVPVYDFGQAAGAYYLVMEHVDGWDLSELLRLSSAAGRRLAPEAAAYIVHELAAALHYIHQHRRAIVHRDVSPHNIFVTREGHVKLADFGVAKAEARLARTVDGQIKGKLAYLAPEQISGEPATARTDVYAAGLVLFELLTGQRHNVARRDIDALSLALNPPTPRRPSQLVLAAAPLDSVVLAALQRHPAMRTRDAALLGEQLARYLAKTPFDARAMAAFAGELEGQAAGDVPGALVAIGSGEATLPHAAAARAAVSRAAEGATAARRPESSSGTLRLGASPARQPSSRWRWRSLAAVGLVLAVGAGSAVYLILPTAGRAPAAQDVAARSPVPGGAARAGDEDATGGAAVATGGAADATGGAADASPTLGQVSPRHGQDAGAIQTARRTEDAGSEATAARPRASGGGTRGRVLPRVSRTGRRPAKPRSSGAGAAPSGSRTPSPKRGGSGAAPSTTTAAVAVRAETDIPPVSAPPGAERLAAQQRLRGELRELMQRAQRRGIWPGDDGELDRRRQRARQAIDDGSDAAQALRELAQRVEQLHVDAPFIRRKLDRLERAIARSSGDDGERRRLSAASQRILRLVLSEQLVEASRQISALLARLQRKN